MEQQNDMKKKMMMIGAASVVIILVVIFIVVTVSQRRMSQQSIDTTGGTEKAVEVAEDEGTPTGLMGLSVKGGKAQFARGDQITVFAYANSYGSPVTAYDAVIRYNPEQLAFNEATSLQNGMDLLDTDMPMDDGQAVNEGKSNELIITGVQSLSRQEPFVFDGTELAEMTFTALAPGTINLALYFEKGSNRDSNLFDDSTNDILSKIEGITLVIR